MTKVIEFVPLTNDLLFKEVLTNEETRKFLIYFLEIFTELPREIITDNLEVTYEKPLKKSNYYDKGITGDVLIHFSNYIVNIEMYSTFKKRSLAKSTVYGMRIFSTQLKRGEDYEKIKYLIQLNLIDKVKIKFNRNLKSIYTLTDIYNDYEELMPGKFEVKFYRIDKAKKEPYNEDKEHLLLRYIGAKSNEERLEIAKGDEVLMETENMIKKYLELDGFAETMAMWKRRDEIETAMEEGEKKGKMIGKKIGKKIGEASGARNKALEMAKGFKEEGIDINTIAKISKLSIEEIEKL